MAKLTGNKILEIVKYIQHSLFMWFILSYGTMYLIGIFTNKNIYAKFERDFTDSIASQTLENRVKNLNYIKDYLSTHPSRSETDPSSRDVTAGTINELIAFVTNLNESGINIYSIITPINTPSLSLENNIIWHNIDWEKLNNCLNKSPLCPNQLLRAHKLGLDHKYENYYVNVSKIEINNETYANINLSKPSVIINQHLDSVRSTEHLSQFVMFFSFICYILISYGAVRPLTQYVRKMRKQKLDSINFKYGPDNELNHVRTIRTTIYEALIRKEQEEKERLTMQTTLVSQQKEAEVGKIVAQISHDLKSPLIIFEDILRENSYTNFSQHFESAKRSLNKIFSLVYSLKQADKESFILRTISSFSFESIIAECTLYAQTKNLHFETNINISEEYLLLDHQKLERSINNILRNAVEYAKSKIRLDVQLLEDTLVIKIYDDGEGVPEEVLPKLFQWRNTGNAETGTGIGLYYARQIALAHGGDLTYSHENGETIFEIQIPGVVQSNEIQSYGFFNDLEEPKQEEKEENVKSSTPSIVAFFIKDKNKHDLFQSFMASQKLSCVFFQELSDTYIGSNCSILYTDTSDAILEHFIERGVHIILAKDTDIPELIYKRLERLAR